MAPGPRPPTLADAREVLERTGQDPAGTRREALALLRTPGLAPDARVVALTAAGQAGFYLGQVGDAHRELKAAVRSARRIDSPDLPVALMVLGRLLVDLARPGPASAALAEADRLLPPGPARVRLASYQADLAAARGRIGEAIERYTALLGDEHLEAGSDRWATALHNRALHLARAGRFDQARRDLAVAMEAFEALGEPEAAAGARANLGWVCAREGDLPAALVWFGAPGTLESAAEEDPACLLDFCDVLLAARLLPEASETAEAAAQLLADNRLMLEAARADGIVADARLEQHDRAAARAAAQRVVRRVPTASDPVLVARARLVLLRCDLADGVPPADVLRRALALARVLASSGGTVEALQVRLVAAELAIGLGRTATARRLLRLDPHARSQGPLHQRCAAWHADALLRMAEGNRAGARRAVRHGLAAVDAQRAGLGAGELRATVSGHGAELARLGVRLAVEDGDARAVLAAAERWRAASLLTPPAKPPADPAWAADLQRLRQVGAQVRAAGLAGEDTTRLRARQAALEAAVRRRARLVEATDTVSARGRALDVAALRRELGDRVLVEYVTDGPRLLAVTLAADLPPRLHDLGPTASALHEIGSLHFALRLLGGAGPATMARSARGLAADAAARLDDLLVAPWRERTGAERGRPLVVVPTGDLHAVPWSILPSCASRPLTTAPSAASWLRAAATGPSAPDGTDTVLVAGPGLRYADAELDAIARGRPGARVLRGDDALVDDVLAALDGARLAHVAAHGSFRADNPLFSSLRLADGALTVYDLQRLTRAPELTVLSSCDVGMSHVTAGDEVLGVTAALLGLGGGSLIASVLPVRDAETVTLMTGVHAHLRAGRGPAAALAAARADLDDDTLLATAGMTCFGRG